MISLGKLFEMRFRFTSHLPSTPGAPIGMSTKNLTVINNKNRSRLTKPLTQTGPPNPVLSTPFQAQPIM